jgi:DnaD N-terminal domain
MRAAPQSGADTAAASSAAVARWTRPVLEHGFTIVPNLLLSEQDRLGLSSPQCLLLIQLATYWWESDKNPFPSKALLAKRMGLSERQVQRHVSELIRGGFLRRQREEIKGRSGRRLSSYDLSGLVRKLLEVEAIVRRETRVRNERPTQNTTAEVPAYDTQAEIKSSDIVNDARLMDIERPYLLVDNVKPVIRESMYGALPSPEKPSVVFSIKNHGRSPAFVSELRALLTSQPTPLPFDPPFGLSPIALDVGVIGANDSKSYVCGDQYPIRAEGERRQIENDAIRFWLFISLSYDDVAGRKHLTRVRFRYEFKEDRFVMLQPDSYTIRT